MRLKLLWATVAMLLAGDANAVPSKSPSEDKAKADLKAQEDKVKAEVEEKERDRKKTEKRDDAERKQRFKKSGKPRDYHH